MLLRSSVLAALRSRLRADSCVVLAVTSLALALLAGCVTVNGTKVSKPATPEVRGTWITTTANDAVATPQNTAASMRRLREIGLNTVYVEVWKDGYTQFPSESLNKLIGARSRPSDRPPRDPLQEMLIEAHRNGLITIAWFEYGFMAAHKSSMTRLRQMKPAWLSRDIQGSEVAPNGFVWLNPLHPEARKLLLDIVLEAVDKYDLDGVQLDDRIVWPHITMGYDDYTRGVYAAEHGGRQPPEDYRDAEWMRWRADKVNEYARMFVQEVRARRPGLVVSLSPAVYPWSREHYLLDWPQWMTWAERDRSVAVSPAARNITPHWDEFIPQAYRLSYQAFEKTWIEQNEQVNAHSPGGSRSRDLIAGIRVVGDGEDSTWEQLRDSILLARKLGNGGHVLWFSRGVLDLFPAQLTSFYDGHVASPHFSGNWRRRSIALYRSPGISAQWAGQQRWYHPNLPLANYRMIGFDGRSWTYLNDQPVGRMGGAGGEVAFYVDEQYRDIELIVDRREEMMKSRRPR